MLNVRKVKFFNHIKKAIILLFLSVITIFIIDYFTEEEVVADLVIANNNIVFGKTKVEDIKIGLSLDWEPASDMEEDSLYCYRITFKKYGGLVADHDVSGAIFCKEDKIVYVSIFINNENLSREFAEPVFFILFSIY